MTAAHHDNPGELASQTTAVMEFVSDLRDITTPQPQRRQVANPDKAASLITDETLSRVGAILDSRPGEPVVLLSGGVDSILVAAAAVAVGVRPHAITIVTSTGTDKNNAVKAAGALGLTHDVVELDARAVVDLARDAMARLEIPELWEVTYAIPLLAAIPVLNRLDQVGPILTGSGADAISAGGKTLGQPLDSASAAEELDRIIREESSRNFAYDRLVPDFHTRVIGHYADRFVHVFQTVRFWEIAETFAPAALFGEHVGEQVDKLCLRLACESLLPETAKPLAWAKKSPIQRSTGIMGSLATAAREFAASLPGASTYSDPRTESFEAVATRLFLAAISHTDHREPKAEATTTT